MWFGRRGEQHRCGEQAALIYNYFYLTPYCMSLLPPPSVCLSWSSYPAERYSSGPVLPRHLGISPNHDTGDTFINVVRGHGKRDLGTLGIYQWTLTITLQCDKWTHYCIDSVLLAWLYSLCVATGAVVCSKTNGGFIRISFLSKEPSYIYISHPHALHIQRIYGRAVVIYKKWYQQYQSWDLSSSWHSELPVNSRLSHTSCAWGSAWLARFSGKLFKPCYFTPRLHQIQS